MKTPDRLVNHGLVLGAVGVAVYPISVELGAFILTSAVTIASAGVVGGEIGDWILEIPPKNKRGRERLNNDVLKSRRLP